MDDRPDPASYDTDIFAWSQHQADVLRSLAHSRRDLPSDLDLEHVAGEIEDLGNSELHTVEKLLRRILGHAVKLASSPTCEAVRGWRKEIRVRQADALTHFTNAMRQRLALGKIWQLALRDAEADLADDGEAMLTLPEACPLTLDELLSDDFDVRALVARLAAPPPP